MKVYRCKFKDLSGTWSRDWLHKVKWTNSEDKKCIRMNDLRNDSINWTESKRTMWRRKTGCFVQKGNTRRHNTNAYIYYLWRFECVSPQTSTHIKRINKSAHILPYSLRCHFPVVSLFMGRATAKRTYPIELSWWTIWIIYSIKQFDTRISKRRNRSTRKKNWKKRRKKKTQKLFRFYFLGQYTSEHRCNRLEFFFVFQVEAFSCTFSL